MSENYNLPALSNEGSLKYYLQQIKKFPMLSEKQEISLAKKWRDEGDTSAAHTLVTSHLRLVARIAMGYRGYGCLLYTSPSPRDRQKSRMPSSA